MYTFILVVLTAIVFWTLYISIHYINMSVINLRIFFLYLFKVPPKDW